jgi:hypothetical protein
MVIAGQVVREMLAIGIFTVSASAFTSAFTSAFL